MANKIDSQMLKGVLTGSILCLLSEEELYGYSLSEKLASVGFADISKGTIYPLLLSLEKKHYIQGNMRASKDGPNRKYYRLTAEGVQAKEQFLQQWMQLKQNMERLIDRSEEE